MFLDSYLVSDINWIFKIKSETSSKNDKIKSEGNDMIKSAFISQAPQHVHVRGFFVE